MTRLIELLNDENESDRRTLYDDVRDLESIGTKVKIDKSVRPPRLSVEERTFSLSELKLMIDATVYTDDKYYMIAYDGKMRRNYRVDRMENIRILEEKQDGEEEYKQFKLELPFRTQSMFNLFGEEKVYVTLRCPEYYYYTIEDKFGSNLVPRREKDKNEKEYIAVDVPVAVSDQFFAWVFSMKNKVQIVGPINVKKQMHDMMQYVGTRYGLWL